MNLQDPIDQDRMLYDGLDYGTSDEDATDPFLTSLAVIGELAGMGALQSIIDVLEDQVPNFSRARVIEMHEEFAVHYAAWLAARSLKVAA